jgi:hypothetical protein
VSKSVVEWSGVRCSWVKRSESLGNRVSSIIRGYVDYMKFVAFMAFSFIIFLLVLLVLFFFIIVYMIVFFVYFCLVL